MQLVLGMETTTPVATPVVADRSSKYSGTATPGPGKGVHEAVADPGRHPPRSTTSVDDPKTGDPGDGWGVPVGMGETVGVTAADGTAVAVGVTEGELPTVCELVVSPVQEGVEVLDRVSGAGDADKVGVAVVWGDVSAGGRVVSRGGRTTPRNWMPAAGGGTSSTVRPTTTSCCNNPRADVPYSTQRGDVGFSILPAMEYTALSGSSDTFASG